MHSNFRSSAVLIALVLLLAPLTDRAAQALSGAPTPIIVFLTDYGTLDDAVAICKGVMLSIAPDARIVDLTHQVTPYSITDGARYLARAALYYPAGTIFIAVVDPGVGTQRRPIIAKSKRGQYFVVPDNGLVTPIQDRDGIEGAREITNPAWQLPNIVSTTFHGRDIFAPAAAHLARGEDWMSAGPALPQLVRLVLPAAKLDDAGISGRVVALDGPFGNLITNINRESFGKLGYRLGDQVRVKVDGMQLTVPYASTFADVPLGQPLLYIDSSDLVSLGINQGNFAKAHDITPPLELFVSKR
jgi:hypothetical protein